MGSSFFFLLSLSYFFFFKASNRRVRSSKSMSSSLSPPFVSGLGSCEGVPLGTVGNSGKSKLLSMGRLFAGFVFCVSFEEALIEAAGGAEAAGSIPEYGGGPSLAGLTGGVFSSMIGCWLFIAGGFG